MKSREGYTPFTLLLVLIVAMGPFLFGYNTGIISAALIFIGDAFPLTLLDKGMVVSIILFGAMVGTALGGGVTDRIGRRYGLVVNGLVFFVGGYLAYAANTFSALLVARFIIGLGVGFTSQATPLYLGEIAPLRNRGAFISLFELFIAIGILISYFVGFALSERRDWSLMLGFSMIPAAILTIGMLFMVETPSYLIARGHHKRAQRVLQRIHTHVRWEEHLADVKEEHHKEKFHIKALFNPSVRKVLFLAITLSAFQQITGINTVIYFAPHILDLAGFSSCAARLIATMGIGTINVLATVAALRLLDKVGRKPLLLCGIGGMVVSLTLLALCFLINTPWLDRSVLILVIVYAGSFAFSLGPITWVVIGEIFPLHVRSQGIALAAFTNWLFNYFVSLSFLQLLHVIGSALTFFLYAFMGILAFLFIRFFFPETKGKTAAEIQKLLQRS